MKIKILSILFLVALITVNSALALDSTVTRSFSDNTPDQCSKLTVALAVDINEGETYYVIDEHVPSGCVILDSGTGDTTQPGHIKWVILMSAVDTVYTYNVTIPCNASGIYSFDGAYMFENDTEEQTILGETNVDVQEEMESKVIRSFSDSTPDQCSELTVKLDVYVNETDDYYAIDEEPPAGWTISDSGTGNISEAGHIKWILIQGASNITYQYKVLVPCDALGIYSFDGTYMFESDTEEQTILGDTNVDVQQLTQTFDISLYSGWNLISLPLNVTDNTLLNLLSSIQGNYSKVVAYDANDIGNESKVYDQNDLPHSNFNSIDRDKGLWIKMINNDNLKIEGIEFDNIQFSLKEGYNLKLP